jgi:hypothetical protein
MLELVAAEVFSLPVGSQAHYLSSTVNQMTTSMSNVDPPLRNCVKKINDAWPHASIKMPKEICLIPMLDLSVLVPPKPYKSKIGRVYFLLTK